MSTARRSFLSALTAAPIALSPMFLASCGGNPAVRADGSVDLSKVTLTVGDQAGIQQSLVDATGVLGDVLSGADLSRILTQAVRGTSGGDGLDVLSDRLDRGLA